VPTSDYTPTADEVASIMKARLKTRFGAEVDTFTEDTPVKASRVSELIQEAVDELAPAVGPDIPDGPDPDDPDVLRRGVKRVVQLLAAANVELDMWPEQAQQQGSAYRLYLERANSLRKGLLEAVSEAGGGGAGESVAGSEPVGQGGFPPAIGWDGIRW
jgi:hypothetical protein